MGLYRILEMSSSTAVTNIYIYISYPHVRDDVGRKAVCLEYEPTTEMVVYILTNPLGRSRFDMGFNGMGFVIQGENTHVRHRREVLKDDDLEEPQLVWATHGTAVRYTSTNMKRVTYSF